MPSIPMAGKVMVSIVSAIAQTSPSAWHLEYELQNLEPATIWMLVDESLTLQRDDAHIELSYARGKMQPGLHLFGYFDPAVVTIPPGGRLRRSVKISWPCALSDIWNAEREAAPPVGEYEVSVRVGFASTALPQPPNLGEDVEAPVLRWQKEAVSAPVRLAIPPYTPSH